VCIVKRSWWNEHNLDTKMVHPHHLQNPYIVHSPQYKYILILPSVNPAGFVGKINLNKINGSQHDT